MRVPSAQGIHVPMFSASHELWVRARNVLPGGVNSPVRAFGAVGGEPFFVASARGCRITDIDGRSYIDYVGSWGPMILGHAHPEVVEAVRDAAGRGTSYGIPNPLEVELAESVAHAMPSIEKVRFVNSGTEAAMSALRLARGATGRDTIVKFTGCYHGHADSLLVRAGSGAATFGAPDSAGVPAVLARHTIALPFNDREAAVELFGRIGAEIACVIVEPIVGNSGVLLPRPGFLETLRELTESHGAVLIFDEVMTGFRVAYGGAQALCDIRPDLTCLGKIIGGGLPVGAFGGWTEIMDELAPAGPVYQAGTLSGNPLAMAAGRATLEGLRRPGVYESLDDAASALEAGLLEAAAAARVPVRVNRAASMLTPFFTEEPVDDYESAARTDGARFAQFFRLMLDRGVYLPPSRFEAWFVSLAHDEDAISATIDAARSAFRELGAA